MPTASAFLNYTPVALAFGTSGLRGLVVDITDLEAYINVKASLAYLEKVEDIHRGASVVLAGDLRPSTDRIMRAAARAIVDAGFLVENAGKIPTPALILHAMSTRRAGVMVTGSHIPFDRNGIKINKSVGELLKADEPGISREVDRVRAEEYARTAAASSFNPDGSCKELTPLPPENRAAEERYVERYVRGFKGGGLRGVEVLLYEHSAVGRDILARILDSLGAKVVRAGRASTFVPIDTENVTGELLERLEALVSDAEARGATPQVIVSTDGDSDRPLVAAVRPTSGSGAGRVQFLSGDLLGIVVAEYLGADAVAVPISANDAVLRRMTERGVTTEETKIGSPYVVAAIDELSRRGGFRKVVGWEANGGFLLGSTLTLDGPVSALPTRDATLPILANLLSATEHRVSLPELWSALPARFGRSGLLDNVPVAVSRAIVKALEPPQAIDLARFFTPDLGFGPVARVNMLDGARIYFEGGDIAHVRASGNAPQLRIYANSDTQRRADEIVELALREPDGILRQLEQASTKG